MTKNKIDADFRSQHDILSKSYYKNKTINKATFDAQHGQLWDNHRAELIANGHITVPSPKRDLEAEIDTLKLRIMGLENK